ncbi:hypothetical protein OG563_36820 [Nocardia vinacea]|uniref:Uncharacterized protein n=1 Tax=Nocardia vinacea TaxID=96468 RepID=A0ABZ1YN64_9NOCA|nr:hypothetical protein [Nocardia vinacea]
MTNAQTWDETLEDLERLLDPGTFHEFGTLVGGEVAADGIVTGSGLIDDRRRPE